MNIMTIAVAPEVISVGEARAIQNQLESRLREADAQYQSALTAGNGSAMTAARARREALDDLLIAQAVVIARAEVAEAERASDAAQAALLPITEAAEIALMERNNLFIAHQEAEKRLQSAVIDKAFAEQAAAMAHRQREAARRRLDDLLTGTSTEKQGR
jgi:hypothetical protein